MESVKDIETLMARYFEGETTVADERRLEAYFHKEEVASHLEEYRPLFTAFRKTREETFTEVPELPNNKRIWAWSLSAAAAVLLIMGLFFQTQSQQQYSGTYEDEAMAVLKAKQTLGMLSKMLSQSTAQLDVVSEFNNAPAPFITN